MTGICGATGAAADGLDDVADVLRWTGSERTATHDENTRMQVVHHPTVDARPVTTGDGSVITVWGCLFGYLTPNGEYHPRDAQSDDSSTEYLASLYEEFGRAVLERLNGQFAAVIADESADELTLVCDRVASHPLYYAMTADGDVVFSSNVQSLPFHRGVETRYEAGPLAEYFTFRRIFGTSTPFVGIHQLPPASVTRIDLTTGDVESDVYWRPTYRPSDRPYRALVEDFVDLFVDILAERADPEERYGLLLSGGVDSRFLLAALDAIDQPVTAFHSNEWENREAAIARRVADHVGVPFQFLHRSPDYQSTLLRSNGPLSQFNSTFTQGHLTPFASDVEDVDVLLSGDTREELFGGHTGMPTREINVGIGTTDVPFLEPMSSVREYIDYLRTPPPPYVADAEAFHSALDDARERPDGTVEFHGVVYPSLSSLQIHNEIYPFTDDADYVDTGGLYQLTRHWSPFIDVRLLDFATRFPLKYRLRRRFVTDALAVLDPELARIPDANSGLRGTAPFVAHKTIHYASQLRRKYRPKPTPAPHLSHGSWTEHRELIRTDGFLEEFFDERAFLVDEFDFLSRSGLDSHYRAHLDGEDNHWTLYSLATFLAMPATEHLAG